MSKNRKLLKTFLFDKWLLHERICGSCINLRGEVFIIIIMIIKAFHEKHNCCMGIILIVLIFIECLFAIHYWSPDPSQAHLNWSDELIMITGDHRSLINLIDHLRCFAGVHRSLIIYTDRDHRRSSINDHLDHGSFSSLIILIIDNLDHWSSWPLIILIIDHLDHWSSWSLIILIIYHLDHWSSIIDHLDHWTSWSSWSLIILIIDHLDFRLSCRVESTFSWSSSRVCATNSMKRSITRNSWISNWSLERWGTVKMCQWEARPRPICPPPLANFRWISHRSAPWLSVTDSTLFSNAIVM